jgi:transcriptional regulator with XRE-family HTH domain
MGIGERLKEVREALGYTQEQMGGVAGVRKQSQHLYEKGERIPDAAYLTAIAAIGADVMYILTGGRVDSVARTSQEVGLLARWREMSVKERYAVIRLMAVLTGVDTPPEGWAGVEELNN